MEVEDGNIRTPTACEEMEHFHFLESQILIDTTPNISKHILHQKGTQKSTINKKQSKGLIMPDSGPLQLNSSYLLQLELDEQQAPEKPTRAGLRGLRGKIQVLEEEGEEYEEKKIPNKRGRKPNQNQEEKEVKEHTERILQNENNNVFVKKEIEEA